MEDFDAFLRWLRVQPGTPPGPFASWQQLLSAVEQQREAVGALLIQGNPAQIDDPGFASDFESWTDPRRLRWNLNALRALKRYRPDIEAGRAIPMELLGRVFAAYTGWGGFTNTKLLGELPEEGLFSPDIETAIREIRAFRERGTMPGPAVRAAESAIQAQYFTPVELAATCWSYAERILGDLSGSRVLEPSMGSGRFLATAPVGVRGDGVELDPQMALMASVRFPDFEVFGASFEEFAVAQRGAPYDLVIGNPPFMDRPRDLAAKDPTYANLTREEHYFLLRALPLLRAGGAIVYVTPDSLVRGTGPAHTDYRTEMFRGADFHGAVLLPEKCFPRVAALLCVQCWVKRDIERPYAEARALAEAPYNYPVQNVLGTLVETGFRDGVKVEGHFDLGAAQQALLQLWQPSVTPRYDARPPAPLLPSSVPPRSVKRQVRSRSLPVDPVALGALQLGLRLNQFYQRIHTAPTLAEVGRTELALDVSAYVARHGIPASTTAEAAAQGWGTYQTYGISPTPIVHVEEAPQAGTTPLATVAHFCGIQGYCDERDLARYFPGQDLLAGLLVQGVCVEFVVIPGEEVVRLRYYTEEHYLTGDLTARLDATKEFEKNAELMAEYPVAAPRVREQAEKLQALIGEGGIMQISLAPRSPLVPLSVLSAWAASYTDHPSLGVTFDGARFAFIGIDLGLTVVDTKSDRAMAKFNGRDPSEYLTERVFNACIGLLGYLNRESMVRIPGREAAIRVYDTKEYEARAAAEREIEDAFTTWLQQPDNQYHADLLLQTYHAAMHRETGRIYATTPLPIATQSPGLVLLEHQNQSVRWQAERVGGFVFDSVGAGKTYLSLACAAIWRQNNRARRVCFVVPNNTVGQWYSSARKALPLYRTVSIGMSVDEKGQARADTPDMRKAKWDAVKEGHFDLILVGRDVFLTDVYVSEEIVREVRTEEAWLRRGAKRDQEQIGKLNDKLDKLATQIESARQEHKSSPTAERKDALDRLVDRYTKLAAKIKKAAGADITDKKLIKLVAEIEGEMEDANHRPENPQDFAMFEDLGIDALVVDEAQWYKNLWHPAKRLGAARIEFMGSGKDEEDGQIVKCWDLLFKTRALVKARGDGQGVMILTATPLKNTPLELYNLGCYLGPQVWKDRGILTKEDFIDRFIQLEPTNTLDVMTQRGQVLPGVDSFKNLNELRSILAPIMHRRSKEDLLTGGVITLPPVVRETRTVAMGVMQSLAYEGLQKVGEAREWRKENQSAQERAADGWTWATENTLGLVLMSCFVKVSLDPRLLLFDWYELNGVPEKDWAIRPTHRERGKFEDASEEKMFVYRHIFSMFDFAPEDLAAAEPPAKFTAVAQAVSAQMTAHRATGRAPGGHLLFVDFIEAQSWVIDELVAYGVPRGRIAVMPSEKHKKDEIMRSYNGKDADGNDVPPKYDVLIGTSGAMAEGLNLQFRTCAIHHLTFPWEPATIAQREGRAERQGNTEPVLYIYQYVNKQSFDGVLVNRIQGKADWQNAFFNGSAPTFKNPAVENKEEEEGDREEFLILFCLRDPEEAKKKFEKIRRENAERKEKRALVQAWDLWIQCYSIVREGQLAGLDVARRERLSATVSRKLQNAPVPVRRALPAGVESALLASSICYPDLTNGHVFYPGGMKILAVDGGVHEFRICNAKVNNQAIELGWRVRGDLKLRPHLILKPLRGKASGGLRLDSGDRVEPIEWSLRREAEEYLAVDHESLSYRLQPAFWAVQRTQWDVKLAELVLRTFQRYPKWRAVLNHVDFLRDAKNLRDRSRCPPPPFIFIDGRPTLWSSAIEAPPEASMEFALAGNDTDWSRLVGELAAGNAFSVVGGKYADFRPRAGVLRAALDHYYPRRRMPAAALDALLAGCKGNEGYAGKEVTPAERRAMHRSFVLLSERDPTDDGAE